MNNQHMRHSWLIYFKYDTQFKFPNWFQEWWNWINDYVSPQPRIKPQQNSFKQSRQLVRC
ncbi:hypothetical protein Gotur_019164 [Gossypium turneri]